jgi:2-amino-4-hydroxy-6-hydroxymethyldihydropteridine diphosphokinase
MIENLKPGYILGIGSNINPETNINQIISLLLTLFPRLTLSRVIKIPPVGMNSQHYFLNVAVYIETDLSKKELKSLCNKIESQLGRDRNDPASKIKDRTADLDILFHAKSSADLVTPVNRITDEYFLYPLLEELIAYLLGKAPLIRQDGTPLQFDDLSFGQTATTIYRNTSASDKGVIQQTFDG